MEEIWKDIPEYEGLYQASNLGKIRSLKHRKLDRIKVLSDSKYETEYTNLCLIKEGKKIQTRSHRLIAQCFIPNPNNKPFINHKNGIKNDNRVENLEWVTASENQIHKYEVLKQLGSNAGKFGDDSVRAKKITQFNKNGDFIKDWGSISNASRTLQICPSTIADCCRGKKKTSGGFKWKFK